MNDYIIESQNLCFRYNDGTKALKGISLAINKGEKVAFLGANGAGKSTFFLHLNGILRPGKGKVIFDGEEIRYDHRSLMQLRRNIGIVFQDPDNQIFSSNVLQEISFGPLNLGLSKQEVRKRADAAMEATNISDLINRPVHFLSYGQKKRVAIAGVLAMHPRVIILDEPTAGLDPRLTLQMAELFDKINKKGVTIIISTHDVDLAYSWADRVFIMNQGRITCDGRPEKVFIQKNVLKENDLTSPWLLDVYKELKRKGWLADHVSPPRTKDDLFSLINQAGGEAEISLMPKVSLIK